MDPPEFRLLAPFSFPSIHSMVTNGTSNGHGIEFLGSQGKMGFNFNEVRGEG